jgi:ribokinase
LLGEADILVVNETELAFFLGITPPDSAAEAAIAARRLLGRDGQWVVVTLGANGIVAVRGDETLAVPAPRVPVVDTTGAGDTFCGVLAACRSEGIEMARALRFACVAASLAVQRVGAAVAMPTRAEVDAAMRAGSA